MRVIHNTCFGSFRIENNLAISVYDDDIYYTLPRERMSDKEIKQFFATLPDVEEQNFYFAYSDIITTFVR